MIISNLDLYCLARWFAGKETTVTAQNAIVAMWIATTHVDQHFQVGRKLFQNYSTAIFNIDPDSAPPKPPPDYSAEGYLPPLPVELQVTAQQMEAANKTGRWLNEYMEWISKRASMTPQLFLQSGGLTAIGIAIARRVVLRLDHEIYSNGYDLWIAPTSYFRKSTGLRAITQLVRKAFPHLLLPSSSTPEMIQSKLSGKVPTNYSDLPPSQQRLEDSGRVFAAQRAMIVDEATKMLFSQKKYMEGLSELLMEMFDPSDLVERELKGEGKLLIRQPSVTVLGATTPARLARSISDMEWEDGVMARFALLTPTETTVKRSRSSPLNDDFDPPAHLVTRLQGIYNALPQPPEQGVFDEDTSEMPRLSAGISQDALAGYNEYADFMHEATNPKVGLDIRLVGNYARLPTLALKTALRLSVMDWVDDGAIRSPTITLPQWHRALLITEQYRESAHRLLNQLNRSSDIENEEKVLDHVRRYSDRQPTEREVHHHTHIKTRKDVKEAISALIDAGEIVAVERKNLRGPSTVGYTIPES
jgi:hypothetical protein